MIGWIKVGLTRYELSLDASRYKSVLIAQPLSSLSSRFRNQSIYAYKEKDDFRNQGFLKVFSKIFEQKISSTLSILKRY
jgi:hypothetical protein